MKRIAILLVFVLPILVFLFLKYFGKNEFDIPVFYKDESPVNEKCGFKYLAPYKVPDSIMVELNGKKSAAYLVIDSVVSDTELLGLVEKFPLSQVKFIKLREIGREQVSQLKDCFLFLVLPNNAVLVDSSRQIRGYYSLPDLDEMDKLEVELNVLLKKY
jgi:hypothetical protein